MDADAKMILTAPPPDNWKRPPGRPRTTWLNTIQHDLRAYNLTLNEAVDLAQNRPLWRLMSTLEACSEAGDTGTPRGPRRIRGDGYGAYGGSVVSGTELYRTTAGRGHTAKSCCVKIASPRTL